MSHRASFTCAAAVILGFSACSAEGDVDAELAEPIGTVQQALALAAATPSEPPRVVPVRPPESLTSAPTVQVDSAAQSVDDYQADDRPDYPQAAQPPFNPCVVSQSVPMNLGPAQACWCGDLRQDVQEGCCNAGAPWTAACVNAAKSLCEVTCQGNVVTCPIAIGVPAGSGPQKPCNSVFAAVCAVDAFCCNTSWDQLCVAAAKAAQKAFDMCGG